MICCVMFYYFRFKKPVVFKNQKQKSLGDSPWRHARVVFSNEVFCVRKITPFNDHNLIYFFFGVKLVFESAQNFF